MAEPTNTTGYLTDWGGGGSTALGVITTAHITFWETMQPEFVRRAEKIALGKMRLTAGEGQQNVALVQQVFEEETQFERDVRAEYRIPGPDLIKWNHASGSLWGIRVTENIAG